MLPALAAPRVADTVACMFRTMACSQRSLAPMGCLLPAVAALTRPADHALSCALDITEVAEDASTRLTHACRGDTFRHSSNLFSVGEYLASLTPDPKPYEGIEESRRGVRKAAGDSTLRVVDWLALFGGDNNIELAPYSNDRIWRVLSLFAPDVDWQWPPRTPLATDVYPFSARPSQKLTRDQFLQMARDLYRGAVHASLDLTRGLAAGPYGDPTRHDVTSATQPPGAGGSFPRAISMMRTSYSHVTELGRPAPKGAAAGTLTSARIWAAQGAPHAAVYSPIHVLPAAMLPAATCSLPPNKREGGCVPAVSTMPATFTSGSLHRADAFDPSVEASSHWWRTSLVNHWSRAVGYDFAWKHIEAAQAKEEGASAEAAEAAEVEAAKAPSADTAAAILAAADAAAAQRSAIAWRSLIQTLMMRYACRPPAHPHSL